MFFLCRPPTSKNCYFLPVLIRRWRDTLPVPVSFFQRVVWRLQIAGLAAFGPRPHPWLAPELLKAGVTEAAITDMQALSTIAAGAEMLNPALRVKFDEALREAAAKISLPAGLALERRLERQ